MIQHTPGPWDASSELDPLGRIVIKPAIGCAFGVGDEARANALMIAAAPDLLEALSDLVDRCEFWQFEVDLEKSKSAIAKAKGETT